MFRASFGKRLKDANINGEEKMSDEEKTKEKKKTENAKMKRIKRYHKEDSRERFFRKYHRTKNCVCKLVPEIIIWGRWQKSMFSMFGASLL